MPFFAEVQNQNTVTWSVLVLMIEYPSLILFHIVVLINTCMLE